MSVYAPNTVHDRRRCGPGLPRSSIGIEPLWFVQASTVVRTNSTRCPSQCESILPRELRQREWTRAIRRLALSLREVAEGDHFRGTRNTAPLERQRGATIHIQCQLP